MRLHTYIGTYIPHIRTSDASITFGTRLPFSITAVAFKIVVELAIVRMSGIPPRGSRRFHILVESRGPNCRWELDKNFRTLEHQTD